MYLTIKVSIVRGGVTQIHSECRPWQHLNKRKSLNSYANIQQDQSCPLYMREETKKFKIF